MAVRLTVIGSLPAWPNPGGACSGYLVEGQAAARLRPRRAREAARARAWPRIDAIVITHFHLDHWGDLVPWVWGTLSGPGEAGRSRSSGCRRAAASELRPSSARLGSEDMFERAFEVVEYEAGVPFTAAPASQVTAVAGRPLRRSRPSASASRATASLAYSGDSGPCDALAELARDADLFLCEATLERGELDGPARAPVPEEASGLRGPARGVLLTHRPGERPSTTGLELAYDGLELDSRSTARCRRLQRAGRAHGLITNSGGRHEERERSQRRRPRTRGLSSLNVANSIAFAASR